MRALEAAEQRHHTPIQPSRPRGRGARPAVRPGGFDGILVKPLPVPICGTRSSRLPVFLNVIFSAIPSPRPPPALCSESAPLNRAEAEMAKKTEILLETGTTNWKSWSSTSTSRPRPGPCPVTSGQLAKVMQVIESPRLTHPESATHASFLGVIPCGPHPAGHRPGRLARPGQGRPRPGVVIVTSSARPSPASSSPRHRDPPRGLPEVIPPSKALGRVTRPASWAWWNARAVSSTPGPGIHPVPTWTLPARPVPGAPRPTPRRATAPCGRRLRHHPDHAQNNLEAADRSPHANNGSEAMDKLQESRTRPTTPASPSPISGRAHLGHRDAAHGRFTLTKSVKNDPVLRPCPDPLLLHHHRRAAPQWRERGGRRPGGQAGPGPDGPHRDHPHLRGRCRRFIERLRTGASCLSASLRRGLRENGGVHSYVFTQARARRLPIPIDPRHECRVGTSGRPDLPLPVRENTSRVRLSGGGFAPFQKECPRLR